MPQRKKCKQVKTRCARKPVPSPSEAIKKQAKKLRIKTKLKVGSKRVWKKESILKKQIKRELKRRQKKEKALLKKRKAKGKAKGKKVQRSRRRKSVPFGQELKRKVLMRDLIANTDRLGSEFGRYRNVRPHSLSMAEHITGMPNAVYLKHVKGLTRSNRMTLGNRINPSMKSNQFGFF